MALKAQQRLRAASHCQASAKASDHVRVKSKVDRQGSKTVVKHCFSKQILVGGLEHFLFSHILEIIIPIDFHIFQRGSNNQPEYQKCTMITILLAFEMAFSP